MFGKVGYFFWILLLALGLMLLILAAQVFTSRNVSGLNKGNKEAAVTFTINNSLQEMVNLSFTLEAGLDKKQIPVERIRGLYDSLTMLGYNASVLEKLNLDSATKKQLKKLNELISRQVDISMRILGAREKKETGQTRLQDSLSALQLSDNIYNIAVEIGKGLEKKLQATLLSNTDASAKLSSLNKALGLIAITAILLLGTIIINRHLKQVQLIRELGLANEEVKKASMIKDQFLANMSHEIRTPLNAVIGFSHLMQRTALNIEQQQYIDLIEKSSNSLFQLVNDILDISKIEAGKMYVEHQEFDPREIMQSLQSMFLNQVEQSGVRYVSEVDYSVPEKLLGDRDKLFQVLTNLVSNAIKFTPDGKVSVRVETEKSTGQEVELKFSVKDSGIGIARDKFNLIFERFQQVNHNQQNLQRGTGLGLAIVKSLCHLMGGSVSVQSEVQQGSIFMVRLPFEKVEKTEPVTHLVETMSHLPVLFRQSKVLVAEDNPVNSFLLKQLLCIYGLNPEIKGNGQEVLDTLQEENFDLLLLDIQMPVLDGYQTAKILRGRNNNIPIVAMTAYVMPGEKKKCLDAGMNDFLEKPVDEVHLIKTLKKFLVTDDWQGNQKIKSEVEDNLLKLSGGDEKMMKLILAEVIKTLPAELEDLNMIIEQKNTDRAGRLLHHLLSTVSPAGNETAVMKRIYHLQQVLQQGAGNDTILDLLAGLRDELYSFYNSLQPSGMKDYK